MTPKPFLRGAVYRYGPTAVLIWVYPPKQPLPRALAGATTLEREDIPWAVFVRICVALSQPPFYWHPDNDRGLRLP